MTSATLTAVSRSRPPHPVGPPRPTPPAPTVHMVNGNQAAGRL